MEMHPTAVSILEYAKEMELKRYLRFLLGTRTQEQSQELSAAHAHTHATHADLLVFIVLCCLLCVSFLVSVRVPVLLCSTPTTHAAAAHAPIAHEPAQDGFEKWLKRDVLPFAVVIDNDSKTNKAFNVRTEPKGLWAFFASF